MIPSTVIALIDAGATPPWEVAPVEPSAALQLSLAVLMGLILGPVLGLAQVRILRRFIDRPYRAHRAQPRVGEEMVPVFGVRVPKSSWDEHFDRLHKEFLSMVTEEDFGLVDESDDYPTTVNDDQRIRCHL